jgi:hypothetical protein
VTRVVLASSIHGLLHAGSLAHAGQELRVLRVGQLLGLGAWPVRSGADLARLRGQLGPVGWVPRHAERWQSMGGRPPSLASVLDEESCEWVIPARGLDTAERRACERVRAAGGDVVDVEVEAFEVEDGRVVGVLSDCGFEWVDELWTDTSAAFVAEPGQASRSSEVDLLGESDLPWETRWERGPVARIVRDPVDGRRHRVCLRHADQPRRTALAFVRDTIDVASVGAIRTGFSAGGADRWLSHRGVRRVPC